MRKLMVFEGKSVEVFENEGKVLFNPYDCAKCLDLSDSAVRMAISKMNSNQVKKITNSDVKDVDFRKLNNAGENFLTESGVYKLIFKSHKEEAEKFQDWVIDEVLPSVRKHGVYMEDNVLEQAINNPDFMIGLLQNYKEEKEARSLAEQKAREEENRCKLLTHNNKTYNISEIAKELGLSGAKVLNTWLNEQGVQYKRNNTWMLYSQYTDKGYTEMKSKEFDDGRVIYYTKWTGKGRLFILELYNKLNKTA